MLCCFFFCFCFLILLSNPLLLFSAGLTQSNINHPDPIIKLQDDNIRTTGFEFVKSLSKLLYLVSECIIITYSNTSRASLTRTPANLCILVILLGTILFAYKTRIQYTYYEIYNNSRIHLQRIAHL